MKKLDNFLLNYYNNLWDNGRANRCQLVIYTSNLKIIFPEDLLKATESLSNDQIKDELVRVLNSNSWRYAREGLRLRDPVIYARKN